MNGEQIQLGLHLMQLVSDKLFFLRSDSHPHIICGAAFLMALMKGNQFVENAVVVESLHTVYGVLPAAIGVMDYLSLPEDKFTTMTLQLLDYLRWLRYVPALNAFEVLPEFDLNYKTGV